jgi:hypothetical protein
LSKRLIKCNETAIAENLWNELPSLRMEQLKPPPFGSYDIRVGSAIASSEIRK